MSYYTYILASHAPIYTGQDETGRSIFSTNYRALCGATPAEFPEQILNYLQTNGVGTVGTDMFVGSAAVLEGDGTFVLLNPTGGLLPLVDHDDSQANNLSFQITTLGTDANASLQKASSVYGLLISPTGLTLT